MSVAYCSKCCQLLTRPKLTFNSEGVCGACQWEEEKKLIDWDKRHLLLEAMAEMAKYRAKKRGTYDACLGVSGGKDSTFTALYARDELKLNCLLVSAFPDEITEEGKANFDNLVNLGFDCVRIHVNPKLLRVMMRWDFLDHLHFRKATEYPLWASTYTVAKEKNIPLVIQGENAALTLGVAEDMNTDWDATTVYKTNTIAGATAVEHYPLCDPKELIAYTFPDLSKWDGKAIWLNWFVKEWGQHHNAQFAVEHGLKTHAYTEENYRKYGHTYMSTCLDSFYHSPSQMHKFVKYGFGYMTDAACYEIRDGRMTREQGFELIDKYDGLCGDDLIEHLCKWLQISRVEHDRTVDKFANKNLVEKQGDRWVLKEEIKSLR